VSGDTTIRVRDRVADTFVMRQARSRDTAIAYVPAGRFEAWLFARLRRNGALVEAQPGFFFLDVVAYHAAHDVLARRALPIAFFGALALAVLAMLFYR
jgi:hypothetical protein